MNNIKKRYDYLDLLKCIAMLMVVSLHTGLWHTNFIATKSIGSFVQYCIRMLCEGVPIFVLVNGFLLINKNIEIKKHCKKMLKILFLLVFWSVVSYILFNLISKNSMSLKGMIDNTLTLNISNKYNGPLWFLQNLLMLYFVYPIISYTYRNNKNYYYYLFVIVTFFTFIGGLLTSIDNLGFKFFSNISVFINSINPLQNGIFIFYFMLGGVLHDKIELLNVRKNKMIIIIIGLIVYILSVLFTWYIFMYKNVSFVDNYLYRRLALAIIICGIFTIVWSYKNKGRLYNKLILSIGENTLGIFLIHVPIKLLLETLKIINNSTLTNRVVTFIVVFVLSYAITLIIKKIPYINKLVKI